MGPRTPLSRAVLAVAAAGVLVVAVRLWGLALVDGGAELKLNAVPWFGRWETAPRPTTLAWPVFFALVVVAVGPAVARRVRMAWLLPLTGIASGAWVVLLYRADRPLDRIGAPLEGRFEYLAVVPEVDAPGEFVRTFTDQLPTYPIHVQGHPPGMVLLLWVLDRVGLDGSTPAAALILLVAASTPVAVLLTVRELLPDQAVRRAAPFLVLVPAAVWVATTADAFFMGVGAWSTLLVVLGTRDRRWRSVLLAGAGGVLFGLGVHLSYGLAPLGAIAAWVIVSRRSWRALGAASVGGGAVIAAFAAAGFFLLDGLTATSARYEAGVSSERPFTYFVVANLAVLAVSIGPAGVAALASPRRRLPIGFIWAALVAVVVADLSGLSKGEVERIWLPYVPWLLVATGATALPHRADRTSLALQAAAGIALATWLRNPW
ncbi:MAG: hypothetical protein U5K30_14880 [Acidimicrobiales bacterium]|nr:hypothetical protein [Acidimicrobiales bacterium]